MNAKNARHAKRTGNGCGINGLCVTAPCPLTYLLRSMASAWAFKATLITMRYSNGCAANAPRNFNCGGAAAALPNKKGRVIMGHISY